MTHPIITPYFITQSEIQNIFCEWIIKSKMPFYCVDNPYCKKLFGLFGLEVIVPNIKRLEEYLITLNIKTEKKS